MIISKANIKTLLNITSSSYDDRIEYYIPILVKNLVEHCNRHFVKKGNTGYIYDNCDMVFTTTTCSLDTDITLVSGDFITFMETNYNDDIYQVKTYTGGVLTIESAKDFKIETVENAIIALLELPETFISIIAGYISNFIIKNKDCITSEKIDDYSVTYDKVNVTTWLQNNAGILTNYRSPYAIKFRGEL
jgi:hypothetical protein